MDVINILSLLDMGGGEEGREGERKEREEGEKVPLISPDNLPNALAYSALSWPHLCSTLTLV